MVDWVFWLGVAHVTLVVLHYSAIAAGRYKASRLVRDSLSAEQQRISIPALPIEDQVKRDATVVWVGEHVHVLGVRLFRQTWRPRGRTVRAVVVHVHGLNSHGTDLLLGPVVKLQWQQQQNQTRPLTPCDHFYTCPQVVSWPAMCGY